MRNGVSKWVALCAALGGLACAPAPTPPEPTAPAEAGPGAFSGERAAGHLEALTAIGPRPPGSDGARRAREYIAGALRELDLEVVEQRSRIEKGSPTAVFETVNLLATVPGASTETLLLIAPYDSRPGTSDGASGPALLLELGRALQERGPAYTVWLVFVEGDALAGDAGGVPAGLVGTRALVAGFGGDERLVPVRVAVYFDRVAQPGLRVARDLLSNRTWREQFWASARRLGHTEVFPPDAAFESVDAGQRAFLAVGMRRAVVIAAAREPAESEARSGDEAGAGDASPESLAVVGAVSLDALVAISERLAKIDRFVESPVAASEADAEAPKGADAEAPKGADDKATP